MKYEVVNQRVEIGGLVRDIGSVLDESEFEPATEESISEVESLLATGHIIEKENND